MQDVEGFFGVDFCDARAKFLAAARMRGAAVAALSHPDARGAQGETLTIDLAVLGDASAETLLLLTSGTHGVEGFCGSGAQVALLHDDAFVRAAHERGIAVLFAHALNPYGFSHLRRVNGAAAGDHRRTMRPSGRPVLRRRQARVEQPGLSRCVEALRFLTPPLRMDRFPFRTGADGTRRKDLRWP